MKHNRWVLAIAFLTTSLSAVAQKLPSTQKVSLRAPVNIKIDGKATEFNHTFQAYNSSCDFYYTVCNDDNNLYLIIQAVYPDVIKRVLNGGVTFTVNGSEKKNDPLKMSITYPVFSQNNNFVVNFKNTPVIEKGSATSVMKADSFMNANNKRMNDKWKLIKTSGIKDLDTLISVYNEDGVTAAAAFDNKMVYTCELAVDLKHYGLSTANPTKFAYHIMINEVQQRGIDIKKNDSGKILSMRIDVQKGAQVGQEATDFWGEYTLATK